jgi:hypothetical protein
MVDSTQNRFMALYLIPASVLDDWMATDPNDRKAAEAKMMLEWEAWVAAHSASILSTEAAGKTKSVSSSGLSDIRNDIVMFSIVVADSQEAAAKMFESHPHLQIPQSSIQIMAVRPM